jgi:putative Holliday junction resolvase
LSEGGGRLLGIDLGEARIGLALSDPLGLTAQPLEPLVRTALRRDLRRLAELISSNDVVTVVVGLPLLLSGAEGEAARRAREFADALRRRTPGTEVVLWDERLTTAEAERTMIQGGVRRRRRRRVVDGLAAVLILQGYLEARETRGESEA